ncbi:MAG: sugar phosphate isomerase/epimerase [Aggregatilineales bacterium]
MADLIPISVQLYSLRDALVEDFEGVIDRLADIGFVSVEPYGGLPIPAEDAAKLFSSSGFKMVSAHLPPPVGDDKNKVLDMAAAYGIQRLAVPFFPPDQFASIDSIKQLADILNEAHANAKAANLSLGYHNHWWEFYAVEGQIGYDVLLDNIDPAIFMEVDTYWVKTGGHDPVEVISRLGSRAPLLHIKDGPANTDDPMVAAGEGVMDIPGIVDAGGDHVEMLVVELDRCATDMMTAVEDSFNYLVNEGLGHGR